MQANQSGIHKFTENFIYISIRKIQIVKYLLSAEPKNKERLLPGVLFMYRGYYLQNLIHIRTIGRNLRYIRNPYR